MSRAQAVIDAATTEKDWQRVVTDYARLRGWLSYHPWSSMHSTGGYPDLTLVRAGRLVFAELKSAKGKVSPEQEHWHDELRAAGVEVYVWRPAQFDEVKAVLS